MDEQSTDVAAETPAQDSSPETSQPVESAPVSEDVNTQPEEAGEGRSVPYDRFKEVNDQLKQFKEAYSQATAQQPSYGYQEPAGETGLDPAAEQKLIDLMGRAVDQRLSSVTQFVQEQRSATQIEQMRRQYPDFDQYIGEATKVLTEQKDELGKLKDPLTTAYFIAKGRSTPQAVDAARAAGRDDAYKSIDAKMASRPGSPVPKKDQGGQSEIMAKFKAGKLSEGELKANWTKLQEELAQSA